MSRTMRPYFPIIYVRGYAMTPDEIAATVATPYMGFNQGSTKVRQDWQRNVVRHVFESPLIRLMKDHGYGDNYSAGAVKSGRIPARSLIVYRYYDAADRDFGTGRPLSIIEAAAGLKRLILKTRDQVCGGDPALEDEFRVHLVAHSMGGLVCRALLQNDAIATPAERALVDRVFTYATPHNGIEFAGVNVPAALRLWDADNFNRRRMAGYLGLPSDATRVDHLDGKFDPGRFFCLVGTNHLDYDVAHGIPRRLAGEMSDGLVRIDNATVRDAPRAFVHRSHSGPYGIVNSEEGYQNLVRFLFGDVRVDGLLETHRLPLPPSIRRAQAEGKRVRGSYYFEATVAPRGSITFRLTERRTETYSAVHRTFKELDAGGTPRWPVLFSTFLDSRLITVGHTLVFSVDLAVLSTGFEVDRTLWLDQHIPGERLYRNTLTIRVTRRRGEWSLRYNYTDDGWGETRGTAAELSEGRFAIPLESRKGFRGTLRLDVRPLGGPA